MAVWHHEWGQEIGSQRFIYPRTDSLMPLALNVVLSSWWIENGVPIITGIHWHRSLLNYHHSKQNQVCIKASVLGNPGIPAFDLHGNSSDYKAMGWDLFYLFMLVGELIRRNIQAQFKKKRAFTAVLRESFISYSRRIDIAWNHMQNLIVQVKELQYKLILQTCSLFFFLWNSRHQSEKSGSQIFEMRTFRSMWMKIRFLNFQVTQSLLRDSPSLAWRPCNNPFEGDALQAGVISITPSYVYSYN